MRVLRVRYTEEGDVVDWTKVMQVQVEKQLPNKLRVKSSHMDTRFGTINLATSSRSQIQDQPMHPGRAYERGPPKLAEGKYNDLMSLCKGSTPVIRHTDHVAFYTQLPH